jgi:hypothetical protein
VTSSHVSRRIVLAAGLVNVAAPSLGLAQTSVSGFAGMRGGDRLMNHDIFDALLAKRTSLSTRGIVAVDYSGWAASPGDRAGLTAYIASMNATNVAALTRPEQFAFWANLYNAATIDIILDNWPVKTIRDIKPNPLAIGPWKKPVVTVGGTKLSLDDIEHGILRKGWKDPRVHYAVNCASISCPNLPRKALRGPTLESALEASARAYVNHPRGARFTGSALTVSSIYKWYKQDFGNNDAGIIAHLKRYADAPLRAKLDGVTRISADAYDWGINATGKA